MGRNKTPSEITIGMYEFEDCDRRLLNGFNY